MILRVNVTGGIPLKKGLKVWKGAAKEVKIWESNSASRYP